MRFAKLKKQWILRGWTDEPWIVMNWTNGDCRKLSEQMFFTAKACNGMTNFDSIAVMPLHNNLLDKLIKAGIAVECSRGDEVEPYQRYRKVNNPYIRSFHWSITGRCNLKCRHCYIQSPQELYGELSLKDILSIIDQLAEANVHQVELTGGEPFLRSDLLEIMAALAKKQIGVPIIYSNGLLITDDILQGIKNLGLLPSFQISFDGCGTHDVMRGIPGSEQATIEAIRRLRKYNFPVIVSTSIDQTNIGSLEATYHLMKELAVQAWRVAPPQKSGNWRHTCTGLSFEEMLYPCAAVTRRWSEEGRLFHLQMPGYNSFTEMETQNDFNAESYDCTTCRQMISILPDGTVVPCPAYAETPVYEQMPNLLKEPFAKVWSESALRIIINTKKGDVLASNCECAACTEFKSCGGGCRAMAVAATGNLMSVDPQACEWFKSGYHQRFAEMAGLLAT